jgi:hypothetical protein
MGLVPIARVKAISTTHSLKTTDKAARLQGKLTDHIDGPRLGNLISAFVTVGFSGGKAH